MKLSTQWKKRVEITGGEWFILMTCMGFRQMIKVPQHSLAVSTSSNFKPRTKSSTLKTLT
jgi:hypothetical protein